MHSNGNGTAWKLMALLSVLSLGIGLFVMSPIPTFAVRPSPYNLQLNVLRPTSSTVGSIRFTDVDNTTLANKQCKSLLRLTRFWGGTRTWKVSQWSFIKKDEKERKASLYR